jgi:hypothetical protein
MANVAGDEYIPFIRVTSQRVIHLGGDGALSDVDKKCVCPISWCVSILRVSRAIPLLSKNF